jgi:transketolase
MRSDVAAPSADLETNGLDGRSLYLRRLVVRALEGGGRGHVGSSLSLIEIMRVLYDDILVYRPNEPDWCDRDRSILSKGHGCLALYVILADKGFFPLEELDGFCRWSRIAYRRGTSDRCTPPEATEPSVRNHG